MRRGDTRELAAPVALVSARRCSARASRPRRRSISSTALVERRRSSSRCTCSSATRACSRSATSASSRSARGRRACSPCRAPRSRRSCRTSPASCGTRRSATSRRSLLAALAGGMLALVVGLPLMRLSGLAAGIATFAVLEITHNLLRYYEKIGPGLNTFSSVPRRPGVWQAAIGALIAIGVAFALRSAAASAACCAPRARTRRRRGRSGVSIYRQRLVAFVLSGLVAGFAGGLYVHLLPLSYRDGVPRPDVRHARDAGDRRRDEPVGGRRRRARGQRARLVPRRTPRTASRSSAGRSTCPSGTRVIVVGRTDGARADRPADRAHRRARVLRSHGGVDERVCVAGAGDDRQPLRRASRAGRRRVACSRGETSTPRALNEQGLRVSGRADFTARVTASTDPSELPRAASSSSSRARAATSSASLARLAGHFAGRDGDDRAERARRGGGRRRATASGRSSLRSRS